MTCISRILEKSMWNETSTSKPEFSSASNWQQRGRVWKAGRNWNEQKNQAIKTNYSILGDKLNYFKREIVNANIARKIILLSVESLYFCQFIKGDLIELFLVMQVQNNTYWKKKVKIAKLLSRAVKINLQVQLQGTYSFFFFFFFTYVVNYHEWR